MYIFYMCMHSIQYNLLVMNCNNFCESDVCLRQVGLYSAEVGEKRRLKSTRGGLDEFARTYVHAYIHTNAHCFTLFHAFFLFFLFHVPLIHSFFSLILFVLLDF